MTNLNDVTHAAEGRALRTSRRTFLLASLEGCAAAGLAPLAGTGAAREFPTEHAVVGVFERLYGGSPEVRQAGAACLAALGGGNQVAALAVEAEAALRLRRDDFQHADSGAACRTELAQRLAHHVEQDFATERLIEVDGILLARSEAVCMALAVSRRRD
ncbi:MAG: hypothetical protein HY000_31280 [Planctomycetes bacterium]|nr:hypothetical protein [Planctomycetota bacterium]